MPRYPGRNFFIVKHDLESFGVLPGFIWNSGYSRREVPVGYRTVMKGDRWLSFAYATSEARERSVSLVTGYISKTRTLAASIVGIKRDKHRFCNRARKGSARGRDQWLAIVDTIPLSRLGADACVKWREAEKKKFAEDAVRLAARENGIRTQLRNAKAFFSAKNTHCLPVDFSGQRPFHGFEIGSYRMRRYTSVFDVGEIIRSAYAELRREHPEVFKVFLLALFVGLRRSEIDRLQWRDVLYSAKRIQVVPSATQLTKTPTSEGTIRVGEGVLMELAQLQKESKSGWVVEPTDFKDQRFHSDRRYRANNSEAFLVRWLRSKGVNRRNPIHEPRKEFGSIINQKGGLQAASVALRHASIVITAMIYVDDRSGAVADVTDYGVGGGP